MSARIRAGRSPLTSLIGRESDIQRVVNLWRFGNVRLLTLTGPGGVGKTRLALAVTDVSSDLFPDGSIFVDFSAIWDPDYILSRIASALSAWQLGQVSPLDLAAAEIGDRRLLLILDNLEQIAEGAPVLMDLLARCSNLSILVTSRVPLNLSPEQIFPVTPLPLPPAMTCATAEAILASPAIELFVARSRASKPDFVLTDLNASSVLEICRHLDGLPLAIELAAARTRQLPLRALASQLDDALSLLVGGPRDLPARHWAMRDTIAWSYNLLSPYGQMLLRTLSVFPEGFDLEAARFVLDHRISATPDCDQPPSVLDGISSLVDSSLLMQEETVAEDPRFRMLATVREFGLEQLGGNADEHVRARNAHADWCLGTIRPEVSGWHGSISREWLDLLEHETANLEAALNWSFDGGDALTGLHLVASASGYWFNRSHSAPSQHWFDSAMTAVERLESELSPDLRTTVSIESMISMTRLGQFEKAMDLANRELHRVSPDVDPHVHMVALRTLSMIADYTDADAARQLAEEAVVIGRRHPGDSSFPWALQRLGIASHVQGDVEQAVILVEEALDRFRVIGDPVGIANTAGNLALLILLQGDFQCAAKLFLESVSIQLELCGPGGAADDIGSIAEFAALRGDFQSAALLLGANDKAYSTNPVTRQPYNADSIARCAERARKGLGEVEYNRTFDDGARLSLVDALELAASIVRLAVAESAIPLDASDHGLSSRELEVLTLLSLGMTDQQIANALFVSRRTVNSHVAHILTKLDVGSRAGAAAEAVRHNLI
jgi:non-specific serine/threonine protein kinase